MSYPITIYAVFNQEKMCISAYTNNFDAETEVRNNNMRIEQGWYCEPVSLVVDRNFFERLKHIFLVIQPQDEDVIDAETGEVKPKKKGKKKLLIHSKK